jgi:hypothetical protein
MAAKFEAGRQSAVGSGSDGSSAESTQALAVIEPQPIIVPTGGAAASVLVPKLIADAGESASLRFLDFFSATRTPAPPTRSPSARSSLGSIRNMSRRSRRCGRITSRPMSNS